MQNIEIAVYATWLVTTVIISWNMARYGLLAIGIMRPPNVTVMGAVLIGMWTVAAAGYMQNQGIAPFSLFTESAMPKSLWIALGVPSGTYILSRYLILPRGLPEFNRAQIRITHWALTYYRPGEITQNGNELREFSFAQSALNLLEKTIQYQLRYQEISVTNTSTKNIARAHTERGFLFRMMNKYNSAEAEFYSALTFSEAALAIDEGDIEALKIKSLIVFRMGELAHIRKDDAKARKRYQEALAIDSRIGDDSEKSLVEGLLAKVA